MQTLKRKISFIIIGLILLIAIIGISYVITLFRLEKLVNGLMSDNYKSVQAIDNMVEAIERQDSAIHIYLNMDRQKGINTFQDNANTFHKWYSIESNNITEAGERESVEKIDAYYNMYLKFFSQMQEILNTRGPEASVKFYDSTVVPVFYDLKKELKILNTINEKAMFDDKEKVSNTSKSSVYFALVFSSIVLVFSFVISKYFTNLFLAPLRLLGDSIKKVKANELEQHIDIQTNDEIGMIAKEFNEMTSRLKCYEQSNLGNLIIEKNKSLAIVKSISDPLLVLDLNFRIILINLACEQFFNIKEEKVLNRHFSEAIRDGQIFDHISGAWKKGEECHEKIIKIVQGDEFYFNVLVTFVKDSSGKTNNLIVLMQNVTELKELERLKTDFIATISHEFKTPLTSILLAANLLEDGNLGNLNSDQIEILKTIQEDGIKLTDLVIDLIELSKIESSKSIYNFEECNISSILYYSLKHFTESANKKGVALILNISENDNLPTVSADYEKISWVINNLISNALKHTHPGDSISISVNLDHQKLYISIADTGDGIPETFIDKIFDKYFKVESKDVEVRGAGIGLSVAKEIVTAHNGKIWVDSKYGSGSTFTFTLPYIKIINQEAL